MKRAQRRLADVGFAKVASQQRLATAERSDRFEAGDAFVDQPGIKARPRNPG